MDDDVMSTATMTSVTEDLSMDETDTSTNDIETSSQITSSDAVEENTSTVPAPLHQSDVVVKMERDIKQEAITTSEEHNAPPDTLFLKPTKLPKKRAKKIPSHSQPSQSQSGFTFPDLLSTPGKWYEHECFNHYWRHYQFVSMWCQQHVETYKTVVEQYNKAEAQQLAAKQTQSNRSRVSKKSSSARTIRNRKARRRRKAAKLRIRMTIANAELVGSCSSLASSENGQKVEAGGETTESAVEGVGKEENMELEITDEMLDFFAHTHKHRQERDALKKSKDGGKDEKHVNIEDGDDHKDRTEMAPAVRPGSKRTSEMITLYGKGAAMIHGMETALQMTFDRNMDVQQPRLWPNMPFRVVF